MGEQRDKDKVAAVKEVEVKKGAIASKEQAAKKLKMEGMSEVERKKERKKVAAAKEAADKKAAKTEASLTQEEKMKRTERMAKAKLKSKQDEDARKEGVVVTE